MKKPTLFEPQVYADSRGCFFELFRKTSYDLPAFVQENVSVSKTGVLRGLHTQSPPQGKLITVLRGEVFDVAVDVRVGSPDYGKFQYWILNDINRRQVYIPPGYAHGFLVTSRDSAIFHYKCTEYYNPEGQIAIRYDDPDLAIPWPLPEFLLSDKDASALGLKEAMAYLPKYGEGLC